MPRKPSAVLQYKLRIREALRRRIEQAAKNHGVSANYEMMSRIERSFDQDNFRSSDEITAALGVVVAKFDAAFHELNKQGDLLRAVETLVAQIEQLPARDSKGLEPALTQVKQVIKAIDFEATLAARRLHTT